MYNIMIAFPRKIFVVLYPDFYTYSAGFLHSTKEEMTLILKKINPMFKSACCLDIDKHIFFDSHVTFTLSMTNCVF